MVHIYTRAIKPICLFIPSPGGPLSTNEKGAMEHAQINWTEIFPTGGLQLTRKMIDVPKGAADDGRA